MKRIEIKKAKIQDIGLKLEYEETRILENGSKVSNDFSVHYKNEPHLDFLKTLSDFKIHVACICGLSDCLEDVNDKLLGSLKVTGVVFGGSDEHAGIVIIAQRRLGKKVLNLITPFVKYEDEEYNYTYDLGKLAMSFEKEVVLYLEGKVAPDPQLKLEI